MAILGNPQMMNHFDLHVYNELNPVEDCIDEFLEALSVEELNKFSKEFCKITLRNSGSRIPILDNT